MLLNHNKICKINSLPFYLLFFNNFISSFLKKGFCRNRSVCCDISFNCPLKLIANSGSNSSPLIVCMNKQTVKVSREPFPVEWTVKSGKKQSETQDIS